MKKSELRQIIKEEIKNILHEKNEPKKGDTVNIINYDMRTSFKGKVVSVDKFGYNIIGTSGMYKGRSVTLKPEQWDGDDFVISSRSSRM